RGAGRGGGLGGAVGEPRLRRASARRREERSLRVAGPAAASAPPRAPRLGARVPGGVAATRGGGLPRAHPARAANERVAGALPRERSLELSRALGERSGGSRSRRGPR